MELALVKEWLVPLSTFVALITASVGGGLSLKESRLKVKAETRLAQSAELESDIKLLKLFTEIMNIAHARGPSMLSEKAVEKLFSPDMLNALKSSGVMSANLLENATVSLPIGSAAQDAAICAIWVLGKKHEILRPVAFQALDSICAFKSQIASPYLEDLKKNYRIQFPPTVKL